jgi:hypothetical protein
LERRLIEELKLRCASLNATLITLEGAAKDLDAGRAAQARASTRAASELELIEDELGRRATLEHAAGHCVGLERPAIQR